jgi:hypothetical protein
MFRLIDPSRMLRRVTPIELAEVVAQLKTDQQDANPEGDNIGSRSHVKAAYTYYEKVSNDDVEAAPQHIYPR